MSPNPRYLAGRRQEYRTQRMLEAQGYSTVRMAGSHGPFDVIAFSRQHVKAIQVKTGNPAAISPQELEGLRMFPAPPDCIKEAWLWDKGARLPRVIGAR